MRLYYYYSRKDADGEKLGQSVHMSRAAAAIYFAKRKMLPLKVFLKIYAISK